MVLPALGGATDGTLVELARTHKEAAEAAFRALYERYKDEVFAFLARLLGDDARNGGCEHHCCGKCAYRDGQGTGNGVHGFLGNRRCDYH
jgi:hypothetical protein